MEVVHGFVNLLSDQVMRLQLLFKILQSLSLFLKVVFQFLMRNFWFVKKLVLELNLNFEWLLYILEEVQFVLWAQDYVVTRLASSSGAARSMHKSIDVAHFELDHSVDIVDV